MASSSPNEGSIFERMRQTTEDGIAYWSARDLAPALGYTDWRNFLNAVKKAREACEGSGRAVSDHFVDTTKMITLAKGARREVEDVHLSRYACYLVVMNGDPAKEVIALGQRYFADQTRRQELADELARMADLPEAQRRRRMRDEVVERNVDLSATAHEAGVVTAKDFAIFQDAGYQGLYAGETARMIAQRKGLAKGQKILDWMGSEELAANWFRITQTEAKLRRDAAEGIQGKDEASQTHHDVGATVRRTIAELGGTMPEDLPTPQQSIQQLKKAEQLRIERQRQPSLFDALPAPAEEHKGHKGHKENDDGA